MSPPLKSLFKGPPPSLLGIPLRGWEWGTPMNKLPHSHVRIDEFTQTGATLLLIQYFWKALESLPLPNKNLALGKIKDGTNPSQSVGAWYRENSPATVGGRTRFQSPIIKTWVEKGFFVLLLTWVSSSSKASGRHTWTNIWNVEVDGWKFQEPWVKEKRKRQLDTGTPG